MGLLGELFVFERLLLPRMDASSALAAWRGPLGAPKDFEIARVAIEAKTRRGGATPSLSISSESQLDEGGVDSLFLHVLELDEAPIGASQGVTLRDVAERIRQHLVTVATGACGVFESLLSAAGYRSEDDYSGYPWLEGASRIYLVSGGFPRITSSEIRPGVSNVRYSVAMASCEAFATSVSALEEALGGR